MLGDSHASVRQARSHGVGAITPPPIPKAALAIFRLIKLLMCEPKKCVSANQPNCLKNLVETDQGSMVYQFPMINQTLCMV